MALREDRMTWLGSMVRVMVQVRISLFFGQKDTVYPFGGNHDLSYMHGAVSSKAQVGLFCRTCLRGCFTFK